ncbi:DUF4376 domain-containing protein, partial [Escherichia coli]|nr:DUF4376 domain-containing protein [Escherichia coli]
LNSLEDLVSIRKLVVSPEKT